MASALQPRIVPPSPDRARIAALMAGYSIEVTSRSPKDLDACLTHVAPGTDIYISFIPGDAPRAVVGIARALRASGFNPVPHLGARHMPSHAALEDFVARLAGEAGVTQVLAIAGDLATPAGPLASTADVLRTGLLARHGIRSVAFAGHPEGHPVLPRAVLDAALAEKLALAAAQGLAPYIVTQFCFEAAPIVGWLGRMAAIGVACPVHVGLAGPAGVTTLLRFALRCGVGNSLRTLTTRGGAMLRLIHDAAPDGVICGLAAADAALSARIARLHIFPFGGVARSARWANAVRRGAYAVEAGGAALRVGV